LLELKRNGFLYFREKRKFNEISQNWFHENLRVCGNFRENIGIPCENVCFCIHFDENVGIPNIFAKTLGEISVFQNIFATNTFSERCHVLAVLSRLPISRLVQSDLSLQSSPSCLVLDILSKTSCPDHSVLSHLSCPSCPSVPAALPRPHLPLLS
jgi:hypothetical protein